MLAFTSDYMPKHSWRKTILLLSKLRLGLYGILELACPVSSKLPSTTLFLILLFGFSKRVNVIDAKKKKSGVQPVGFVETTGRAVSTRVLKRVKARHLWTNLALSCVAGTHSFEKQYKNRLMQNQAMEITAGWAMRHRAILGDFASPGSQIAMETSIIRCRIARFCFSVTGL